MPSYTTLGKACCSNRFFYMVELYRNIFLIGRFGRVKAMVLLLTIVILANIITYASPNYFVFLFGVWASGFAAIGFGTVMYCWMMELLAGKLKNLKLLFKLFVEKKRIKYTILIIGKWKTVFGCLPHINFAFWGLVVALVAYLVPNWKYMEIIFW